MVSDFPFGPVVNDNVDYILTRGLLILASIFLVIYIISLVFKILRDFHLLRRNLRDIRYGRIQQQNQDSVSQFEI